MDTTTNTTSLPDNILIKNEAELSKKYILAEEELAEESKTEKILKLTPDNVARVEAMIKYDSTYARSGDKNAKARYKPRSREYGGSTAFWMSLLKKALEDPNKLHERYKAEGDEEGDEYSYTYYEILAGAIAAVDRENSTHLTSDGVGRITILDRLANYKRDKLKLKLGIVDLELFKNIANETDTQKREDLNAKWKHRLNAQVFSLIAASEDEKKYDKRFNPSFASKFCHYACFYIFDDAKKDNYPIYDTILRKVLPRYLRHFKLNEAVNRPDWDIAKTKNIDDIGSGYEEYCKAIKRIREVAGKKSGKISGNGFDHLLWYYHKNEG